MRHCKCVSIKHLCTRCRPMNSNIKVLLMPSMYINTPETHHARYNRGISVPPTGTHDIGTTEVSRYHLWGPTFWYKRGISVPSLGTHILVQARYLGTIFGDTHIGTSESLKSIPLVQSRGLGTNPKNLWFGTTEVSRCQPQEHNIEARAMVQARYLGTNP